MPPPERPSKPPPRRRPRGYVGLNHETIGSDILAVLRSMNRPEQVLDEATIVFLRKLKPDDWYPIAILLDLMERMEEELGRFALIKMGRTLFKLSHEQRFLQTAKSARDVVYGIDAMYRHANRGTAIGGWRVLAFEPGRAELEKTTPHLCTMEEGILLQALSALGVPANIEQPDCFRQGASFCRFVITSRISDRLWTG